MKLLDEFGIQLWTVRDATENDFIGVLEKLGSKGMGYTGIEFAGTGGIPVDEMKKVLKENGLKPIGSHKGFDDLTSGVDDEIAYQKALGTEYIVCSWSVMKTKEDALNIAKGLTPVAKKVTEAGFKFGYHNHDHEFLKDNGEYLLDILFDNLPAGTVMELDIYWAEFAGADSLAFMEKHKDKLEILHVKQIGEDKKQVDLDKGFIDFNDVIKKAKAMGVKHFIYEQEDFEVSSMVSAESAIKYINSLTV